MSFHFPTTLEEVDNLVNSLPPEIKEAREKAELSLEAFINLIHPSRLLGHVHKELIIWWTREDALSHQITLLPRDHQKSALIAYRVAWTLTRFPAFRFLYVSSTGQLARKQLKFIKDILTHPIYTKHWPEMVKPVRRHREIWNANEIVVDHPLRAEEAIRDPSILAVGANAETTGMHCDVAVFDDLVVNSNAYKKEAREELKTRASFYASIAGTDSERWVTGTRYHPSDLYSDFMEMEYEEYDDKGTVLKTTPLYEIFERVVEDKGDGTGEFLWPRQKAPNGNWYGFNMHELAKKRAEYLDQTQFRAQYYNNPNDISDAPIDPSLFQYYNRGDLDFKEGYWFYKDRRLNVFAAIDFAFSLDKKADYTSLVVVGVDGFNNYYVLGIARFRTIKISDYYDCIFQFYDKWKFRKLRAEVSVGQKVIVKDLKENYIQPSGLNMYIEEHRPVSGMGSKEERIHATLQPRYNNGQVWHYKGGNTQILEDELVSSRPEHDDVKDALANCIDICIAPSIQHMNNKQRRVKRNEYVGRFGGIA
jgi:hypothetical protein